MARCYSKSQGRAEVREQKKHNNRLKCYAYMPKVTFKKLGNQVECLYCKKLHLLTMNDQGIPFWKPQKRQKNEKEKIVKDYD